MDMHSYPNSFSREMEEITATLREMKFRKRLLGGVSEADVWRQLEKLQQAYEAAYLRQAAAYEALLEDRDRTISRLTGKEDAHGGQV